MGKKSKKTKVETDTTETDDTDNIDNGDNNSNTLLNKFNKLNKKTKLYLGIFIVLILAGLFMWYKNRTNNVVQTNNAEVPIQIQQVIPATNTNIITQPNSQNLASPQNMFD